MSIGSGMAYIAMEYADGPTLDEVLSAVESPTIREFEV
jgi:hypothetical protein